MDAPVGWIAVLRKVGDRQQGILERNPHVSIARVAVESLDARVGHRLIGRKLRDAHELAGAVVGPAVVAASDMAVVAPAFRQLGGGMAAAGGKRRRVSLGIEEREDILSEQDKRL